jgi:hypothetical protein
VNSTNNPQWWLQSHTFVITNTLHTYLASHNIPEDEAQYLCYIQNKVIVGSNRAETDDQGFLRVSRQVWLNKCGMHYTQWIDLLASIGELEIDQSYQFLAPDATPDQTENFIPKCKGFKVPAEKLTSGIVKVDYKKQRCRPLKSQKTIEGHTCGSSDDPHLAYVLECLRQVRVGPNPTFPNDPLRYAMIKQYLEKTHYQAFGLHRAKVGRVFHSIIEMPKEGRVNLRHSNGESFVDVDIKSCHPHLLLPLFTDSAERAAFYKDLQGDIYRTINPSADRDTVKKRTCQYLMAKNRSAEWLEGTDVHSYFTKNYPIFWKEKLSVDNGMAWHLQGLESQIVTHELVAFCKANRYYIIPMHDGCLTLAEHKDAIMGELKRLLREHTGYAVGVEEKSGKDYPAFTNDFKPNGQNVRQFNFASIDTLYEMTDAMDAFQRQYAPLQKRAGQEARHNHSPNVLSPNWSEWRKLHNQMDALIDKYADPIRYFDEKPTTKRKMRV